MYQPIDADVIVVGGGLAGLTAAYWLFLKEPTLHVIVLEGSDRIGGRAYSIPLLIERGQKTAHFDLGAQWVCKEQNQLLQLLDFLGITYYTPQSRGKVIIHYESPHTTKKPAKGHYDFLSAADKFQFTLYILKIEALCRRIKGGCTDHVDELNNTTLEEFIRNQVSSPAVRDIVSYMVISSCGLWPSQISTLFYIFYCISTRGVSNQLPTEHNTLFDLRIKGGAQRVCEKLADLVGRDCIYTGEHVQSVSIGQRYVEVRSGHTSYRSYAVILTVSPKELLNMKFSPPLSLYHIEAIRKTITNTVTNFVVTYERNFWEQYDLSGECFFLDKIAAKGPIDYCASISTPSHTALAGTIVAGSLTSSKTPIYKADVLAELAYFLGVEALHPIDYYEKSWTNESCRMLGWKVGNSGYIREIYDPYDYDKIFFAGADTSTDWYGHMAGAVNSGIKAALEVLYILRPAALTTEDMYTLSKRKARSTPLKSYYGEHVTTVVDNWKVILSLCIITLFALWRIKKALYG